MVCHAYHRTDSGCICCSDDAALSKTADQKRGSEVILFSPFIYRFRVPLNAYRDFLSTVVYAIHELMWPFSDNTLKEPDALGSFLCLKHDVVHNSGSVSYSICK